MPSSEDMLDARAQIREWAILWKMGQGHSRKVAEEIVSYMSYEQRFEIAQKYHGPIYRGPYSPY